jgi:hypothetical protein
MEEFDKLYKDWFLDGNLTINDKHYGQVMWNYKEMLKHLTGTENICEVDIEEEPIPQKVSKLNIRRD